MSELTKNGKNLILENTIVSYSPKDDTIHITSADPDLHGEPFHISLNQSSQTENTLRKILIEQGIIKEELIGTNLPENLTTPKTFNEDPSIFDLGVSRKGTVSWNPAKDSHLGIYGHTGSGKTVVANNILFQALSNQDIWDVYCFDPARVEYKHVENKLDNPDNYANDLDQAVELIEKLHNSMKSNFRKMKEKNASQQSDIEENTPLKNTILFVDEIAILLAPTINEDDTNRAKFSLYFKELLKFGRAAGIYLVHTSQSPAVIESEMRLNIPSSIVMGRTNEIVSKLVLHSNISVRTPKIRGRGYFKFGNMEPAQFQTYWTPVAKFDELPNKNSQTMSEIFKAPKTQR